MIRELYHRFRRSVQTSVEDDSFTRPDPSDDMLELQDAIYRSTQKLLVDLEAADRAVLKTIDLYGDPGVSLEPSNPNAAPLLVVVTANDQVNWLVGKHKNQLETQFYAEDSYEDVLVPLVKAMVNGTFHERIKIAVDGGPEDWSRAHSMWPVGGKEFKTSYYSSLEGKSREMEWVTVTYGPY